MTGLDYIWDFVDNVSPCRLIPHSSEKVLSLNKGEINMSRSKTSQEMPLGTNWIFTSTDLGVESLTPLLYGLN